MPNNINFKHSLIFFISSFLYLDIMLFIISTSVGRLYIENFDHISFSLITVIAFLLSLLLSILYTFNQYNSNQIIYRLRILLVIFPIIIIALGITVSTVIKVKIKNNNNKVNQLFNEYGTYINLKKYYKNLEFRLNLKTNELVKIKYGNKKIDFISYKPLTYEDVKFNKTTKYYIYDLDGAYLFSVIDNEKKNFIVKALDQQLYFYQINIDTDILKKNFKYYELTIIENIKDYDQIKIDNNEYLSIQDAQNYNVYKHYFNNFYVLYKNYSIKPYIANAYPNYNSISYSRGYTNITINNEVYKIYAKIDENFKLSLYEKK